jgi:hypothetical protein
MTLTPLYQNALPDNEDHKMSPERRLAIAVVERTILDATGGGLTTQRMKRQAIEDILIIEDREATFHWWLDRAFDDPGYARERCILMVRSKSRPARTGKCYKAAR